MKNPEASNFEQKYFEELRRCEHLADIAQKQAKEIEELKNKLDVQDAGPLFGFHFLRDCP